MKVPRSVMSGKSPMKTVWLLISPVWAFMNSAVTKSGASYVWSRSLHDSIVLRVSSKRWSRNDSDMEPLKSSIGEISSKISSSPDRSGTSVRPSALAAATRACQRSLPSSQSKALRLKRQEVGDLEWFANLREGQTPRRGLCGGHVRRSTRGSQGGSFHGPFSNLQIRVAAWLRSRVPRSYRCRMAW